MDILEICDELDRRSIGYSHLEDIDDLRHLLQTVSLQEYEKGSDTADESLKYSPEVDRTEPARSNSGQQADVWTPPLKSKIPRETKAIADIVEDLDSHGISYDGIKDAETLQSLFSKGEGAYDDTELDLGEVCERLDDLEVDYTGLEEKEDLVELLRQVTVKSEVNINYRGNNLTAVSKFLFLRKDVLCTKSYNRFNYVLKSIYRLF